MSKQPELIHQTDTWLHFIGGYYKSEQQFVIEARKSGISRRAPAQVVRGMEFGDRLVFLRYVKGKLAFAFAEGHIIGITLEHLLAAQVGQQLIADGRAEYHDGGGAMVQRECGSYTVVGTFVVKASLKETIEIAQKLHEKAGHDAPLFVMVNARLTAKYDHPVYLQPAPCFTRGFIRSDDTSFVAPADFSPERTIVAIDGYQKKERSRKIIDYPALPGIA